MIVEIAGIDGSGKTTQIERLMRWASERGVPSYERKLRSFGRRVLGGIAASKDLSSWDQMFDVGAVELATALEIYQMAHATILPLNLPGQIIITDTYAKYWIATTLSRGSGSAEQVSIIYALLPPPDLSVQLDVSTDVAYQRILARPKGDHILRHGGKERLERLRTAHDNTSKWVTYSSHVVSAEIPEAETAEAIRKLLSDALKTSAQPGRILVERLFT